MQAKSRRSVALIDGLSMSSTAHGIGDVVSGLWMNLQHCNYVTLGALYVVSWCMHELYSIDREIQSSMPLTWPCPQTLETPRLFLLLTAGPRVDAEESLPYHYIVATAIHRVESCKYVRRDIHRFVPYTESVSIKSFEQKP